jgi:hypothetical protein
MARSYKRDSMGRFSGTGGGGGKSKGTSTRAKNTARAAELKEKGTTAIGSRVKAKGFSGQKGAQQRAGGLRTTGGTRGQGTAFTVGKGGKMTGGQKAATKRSVKAQARARSKAGARGKPTAKMGKAPASAAKAKFKELSGKARKRSPFRSAAENRAAAGAKRSLNTMIKKRGR